MGKSEWLSMSIKCWYLFQGKIEMSVLTKGLTMDWWREDKKDMAITSIWPCGGKFEREDKWQVWRITGNSVRLYREVCFFRFWFNEGFKTYSKPNFMIYRFQIEIISRQSLATPFWPCLEPNQSRSMAYWLPMKTLPGINVAYRIFQRIQSSRAVTQEELCQQSSQRLRSLNNMTRVTEWTVSNGENRNYRNKSITCDMLIEYFWLFQNTDQNDSAAGDHSVWI